MLGHLHVVISSHLPTYKIEPYPRSPARAKRRAAKGYPQHHRMVPDVSAVRVGDTLVMSPSAAQALYDAIRNGAPAERAEVSAWPRGGLPWTPPFPASMWRNPFVNPDALSS